MGVYMPGLPFFSFVSAAPQGASPTPLASTTANENNTLTTPAALQALPTADVEEGNSTSFWQYFQAANQLTPLPQGQEIAAENLTGLQPLPMKAQQEVTTQTDSEQLVAELMEVEEVLIEEVDYETAVDPMYATQTMMQGTEVDASPEGLQYLESLRRAQPHVQTPMPKADPLAGQAQLTEGEDGSELVTPSMQTVKSFNPQQVQTPLTQAASMEQALDSSVQATAYSMKSDGQAKPLNLDELNLDPLSEEITLEDMESKPIHETPKTLMPQKEVAAAPTSQLDTTLTPDMKAQAATDALLHQSKDTHNQGKSLALDTPQSQSQSVQEKVNASFNKLDVPPQNPQWNDQVAKRIAIMTNEGMQSARIQLDPPELGSLEIKVKVQHDQVSVAFASNNQMVREALDAQSPRLRELLDQQGVDLVDVNVSEQGQQQNESGLDEWSAQGDAIVEGDLGDMDGDMQNASQVIESDSLVDYFA